MEYDIELFLQIIETEGCRYLYDDDGDGERIKYFLSINGNKRVAICITDDVVTKRTAKDWLKQLGLEDLIERMF